MDSARVFLGGLSDEVTSDALHKYLSIYGRIKEIKLRSGFGFVQFELEKDALDVVQTFSTRQFLGQDVTVQIARPNRHKREDGSPTTTSTQDAEAAATHSDGSKKMKFSVCVKGLSPRTCWQELKDFGRLLGGDVAFCDIDRETRTQGFINYTYEEDADRAVRELNGKELLGHSVRISRQHRTGTGRWERPRDGRSHSPSRRMHVESSRLQSHGLHSLQQQSSRRAGSWRDRPFRDRPVQDRCYDPYGHQYEDYHPDGGNHHNEVIHVADYRGHPDHYSGRHHDRERAVEHPAPLLLPRVNPDLHIPHLLPGFDFAPPMLIPRIDPPSSTTKPTVLRSDPSESLATPMLFARPEPGTPDALPGLDFGTSPLALEAGPDTPSSFAIPWNELRPLPPLPPRLELSTPTRRSLD